MTKRIAVFLIITTAALTASASPAAAHAGDDAPEISEAELTVGPFDLLLALGDQTDVELFPVEIELTSDPGVLAEEVQVRWIDDQGIVRTTVAEMGPRQDGRFVTAVGQTDDHRIELMILVSTPGGQLSSVAFATDVESVPPWIDIVVLVTALWTLPFAAWMVQRFRRTWLRPIRWDRSQLDRYLFPPTPEFQT